MSLMLMWSLLFFSPAYAQTDDCAFHVQSSGNIQVQRMRYGTSKQCMLMVTMRNPSETWRSYSFFESGLFMIFMNFGSGDETVDTGARTYYFLPRLRLPSFLFDPTTLKVTDVSGHTHLFDVASGKYISLEGGEVRVSEKISPLNQGGFAVLNLDALMLDNGFALGELPYVQEEGFSSFKLSGTDCSIENKNLFEYIYGKYADGGRYIESINFKLTDHEVMDLIHSRCSLFSKAK